MKNRHLLGKRTCASCLKSISRMFRNYFKIALRQLKKQKMYSVIKIGGFSLGIAACLLIALYIRDEMSYDRSYPDTDRRTPGDRDVK